MMEIVPKTVASEMAAKKQSSQEEKSHVYYPVNSSTQHKLNKALNLVLYQSKV